MPKDITIMGASFSGVPSILLPQTGGGQAQFFDVSGVTAIASDVAKGKKIILADGTYVDGTAEGETPSYDTPSIEVSTGGLITASANGKSNTKQLTTKSGTTITPSSSQQTAISSQTFATGNILVSAVPTETKSAVTPTKSSQTINATSGKYMTSLTVNAIPSQYIIPSGSQTITKNDTYDVSALSEVVVNVSGGGGSTKNVQCYMGYATVTSTSYTATAVSLTVAKTGTYNISWMGWRSTNSGTSGSQLYIGNSAYGSANTSFTNTYGHSVKLTNVSLTQGQTITIRARARSTSYVMAVGNLCIEEV